MGGISAKSKKTKQRKIGRRKQRVGHAELCDGFPSELVRYLRYCDELPYEADPDYGYLKGLLAHALASLEAKHGQAAFDWAMPTDVVSSKRARSPQAIQLEEAVDEAISESTKRRKLEECWFDPEAYKTTPASRVEVQRDEKGRPRMVVEIIDPEGEDVPSSMEYESYEYYDREEDDSEEEADDDVDEASMDEMEDEEEEEEEEGFEDHEPLPTFQFGE